MIFKRKIYDKMKEWKTLSNGKSALLLEGARRIGKSTIAEEFAQNEYKDYIILDFAKEGKEIKTNFEDNIGDLNNFFRNLFLLKGKILPERDSVIIFDEVQLFPKARQAIKYLVADGRYDYIETGSLISIKRNVKDILIPSEEYKLKMYPMDFEEFLWANGVQDATIQYLETCFRTKMQVLPAVHDTMNKLFYSYIVVGGMPDVVQTYVDTHDIGKVITLQTSLLEQYRQDIPKYADDHDKMKIKAIFDAIPSQLNDKNRRFYVNSLTPSARLNRYENSFKWLDDAGVALPCYNVTEPQMPLALNHKHSLFKLFMNDVGLLCAACMENIQFDLLNGKLDANLGSILENVVAQQLKANGYDLYYFDTTRYGEVDFVVSGGVQTRLIEVKSGKDYKKHKALDNIRSVKEWKIQDSIVLCRGNLEVDGSVTYLPWYMFIFVCPDVPPQGLIYEVDLTPLKEL